MTDEEKNQILRRLPSVDALLSGETCRALLALHGREPLSRAARRAVAGARARLLSGEGDGSVTRGDLERALSEEEAPALRRVINATGVVLHTNLGRAPLAPAAVERVREVASHYTNLEYDLSTGERGSRQAAIEPALCELTGAEAALAVNNNAGAVLLALTALASGREAVVSRGELVEIGGGFRIPDIMAQGGVSLVEVGTTNRTRIADYEAALTERTALLVKVHRSNFAMIGFCEEASPEEVAALGHRHGLPLLDDLGSGCLASAAAWLPRERTAAQAIAAGASLVTFSGDKLLGGPQAGLIVGRRALVEKLRRHPLQRALRIDKLSAAALEATLRLYRDGRAAEIPALAMLATPEAELRARAARLCAWLVARGVPAEVVPVAGQVGGGALPLAEPPSWAVGLSSQEPEALATRLRSGAPPVIGRIAAGRLLLDLRTVAEDEIDLLGVQVEGARAWPGGPPPGTAEAGRVGAREAPQGRSETGKPPGAARAGGRASHGPPDPEGVVGHA